MIYAAVKWYWEANKRLFLWIQDRLVFTRSEREAIASRRRDEQIRHLEKELGIGS